MIHIVYVDDHTSTREPLAFMIDRESDMSIVAEAGSLAEARTFLTTARMTIDVLLLDLGLPDGNGEDLITDLRHTNPCAVTLVLTYFSDRERLARAIEAGAAGIIHKSATVEDVVDAIRRVHAGDPVHSLDQVLATLDEARQDWAPDPNDPDALTEREREILEALAEGLSDREIADRLSVGPATVRTHVGSVLAKLGASSRLHAVVVGVRRGLVTIA